MIIHDFSDNHSVLNHFVSELRNVEVQKDPMRFRRNIERIGEILGYELSKTLAYNDEAIKTPLGTKQMALSHDQIVLCSVMRAGTPLHHGLLNYFDHAENAFISAFRDHPDGGDSFEVVVEYLASPGLDDKILVITDPMLATGKTLENVLIALKGHGSPKQIHIVSVIGSKAGVDYLNPIFPADTHLWISAIDDELNSRGYIIPGLGDAGDLCYGPKL